MDDNYGSLRVLKYTLSLTYKIPRFKILISLASEIPPIVFKLFTKTQNRSALIMIKKLIFF